MNPDFSQMQWRREDVEDNESINMTIHSPSSGVSVISGLNDSPSFPPFQVFSPDYGYFSPISTSSQYSPLNPFNQHYNYSSPSTFTSMSMAQQNCFAPIPTDPIFLEIREQPKENFRFRYLSEIKGLHGSIKGVSDTGSRTFKNYPSVVLHNFSSPSAEVFIRCSLYQAKSAEDGQRPLHPHKLVMRAGIRNHDPHYVKVSKENNFTAVFNDLGVIQAKMKQKEESLFNKIKKEKEFEANTCLTLDELENIRADAKKQAEGKIEISQIVLGFAAFMKDASKNQWVQIAKTVYSSTITNEKAAMGKLSIARMSACRGEAQGGKEIFMFVTKVDKNTIQVRFYETDNKKPDGVIIWEDKGRFQPSDVHHQYGIILKTPPYKNQQIEKEVKVFVQLYRKDSPYKGQSQAVEFTYKPNRFKRKQPCPTELIPKFVSSLEPLGSNSLPSVSLPEVGVGGSLTQHYEQDVANILTSRDYDELLRDLETLQGGPLETDAVPINPTLPTSSLEKLKINEKTFDLLIKSINGDSYGFADLVENGRYEEIQACTLMAIKYNLASVLNSKNDIDRNVLHLTLQNGYYSMFRVFINLGVDVNQSDAYGQTPLHLAVTNNSEEFVKALISTKGVNLNKLNDKGETPLSLSVMNSNYTVTKLLIEAGADPMLINPTNGFNCLHVAVNANKPSIEIIKYLVEFDGSMIFVESNEGKTALQLANGNRFSKNIIDLLSSFNANEELDIDEICLEKLCKIFDSKDNWRNWAIPLEFEDKIDEWEVLESPSRAMFGYLKDSKKSLDDLIKLLDLLNHSEKVTAMTAIDEMIARKLESCC